MWGYIVPLNCSLYPHDILDDLLSRIELSVMQGSCSITHCVNVKCLIWKKKTGIETNNINVFLFVQGHEQKQQNTYKRTFKPHISEGIYKTQDYFSRFQYH